MRRVRRPSEGFEGVKTNHHKGDIQGQLESVSKRVQQPAHIQRETAFLMDVFIQKVRPSVTDDQSPSSLIFLKSDGRPFPCGTLGKRISSFAVKSEVHSNATITATDFRKWIVTTMYPKKQQGGQIDEELLRRLMCHSEKTAKKWYVRQSLTEEAAKAAAQIEKNMKPSPRKRPATSPPNKDEGPSPEKRPLTDEEDNTIKDLFRESIQNNQALTQDDLTSKMHTNDLLKERLKCPSSVKKVADRVRYLAKVEPRIDPEDLPVEDRAERTKAFVFAPCESTVTQSSTHADWSKEDSETTMNAQGIT